MGSVSYAPANGLPENPDQAAVAVQQTLSGTPKDCSKHPHALLWIYRVTMQRPDARGTIDLGFEGHYVLPIELV